MTVTPIKNMDDPRVKRTRLLLVQALESLLREKGFDAISVQDITERATVNRATFYAHYKDKTDLMVASVREHVHAQLSTAIPVTSPLTAGTLQVISTTVFELLDDAYGHCELDRHLGPLLEGTMHGEVSRFIGDWLRANTANRRSGQADLDLTAQTLSSAIIGSAVKWLASDRKQSAKHVTGHLVALLAPGLLGQYEAARLDNKRVPVASSYLLATSFGQVAVP